MFASSLVISIAAQGSASDPHPLRSALPPLIVRRDLQCVQKHITNEPRHQGGKSCKHNTPRAPQISRACRSQVCLARLGLKISTSSVFVNKIVVNVRHAVHLAAHPDARHQRQLQAVHQCTHELQPQSAQRINTGSDWLYCRSATLQESHSQERNPEPEHPATTPETKEGERNVTDFLSTSSFAFSPTSAPHASAVSPAEQLTCQFSRWPRQRNSSHRNRRHDIQFQRQPVGKQVWDRRFSSRCAESLREKSRLATVGVDNWSRTRSHLSELLAGSKGPTSESMKRWQRHPEVPQHLTRRA